MRATILFSLQEKKMPIRNMVAGMILGDSYISKPNGKDARLIVRHSTKQSDYVLHKYGRLSGACKSPPRESANGGYGDRLLTFATSCLPWLNEFCDMAWKDGKRIIGDGLADLLTPEALAYWYMDDGSLSGHACYLSTYRYSREDQEKLRSWLLDRYSVRSREQLDKGRGLYSIRMRKADSWEFMRLISPHVIPSLRYKLIDGLPDYVEPDPEHVHGRLCVVCGVNYAIRDVCRQESCIKSEVARRNREWYAKNGDAYKAKLNAERASKRNPKPCAFCGKSFMPASVVTSACSDQCKVMLHRKQALDRYYKKKLGA